MEIGDIIQRVQSLYSKGVQSDDSRLSSRHIYNKILTVRSKLLSQKAKNKQKISDWNYQTISCIEMIDVPTHECPCLPLNGCTVKRSKYPIPRVMHDYNGNLIDYVMNIDGSIKFDYSNRRELLHIGGNKYTAMKKRYIIDKGYIYAYGNNVPKIIQMRALFEDPIEAINFISYYPSESVDNCIDIFEMEFPIDNDTIDTLIQLSVEELISVFKQNIEDISNDTKDIPVR